MKVKFVNTLEPKSLRFCSFFLVLFFFSPYLILLSQFSLSSELNFFEFFYVMKNTLILSIGSAASSLFFGILGGMGLIWSSRQKFIANRKYGFDKIFLLPSVMPSFFVIISVLNVFSIISVQFPFGKVGVIIIQTLIHVGLVSVLFKNVVEKKLGTLGSLCLIEGASRWQFFRVGILGYLAPDLLILFIYVFMSSMTSFNVPFIVGGFSGKTLEVLIYEKLVMEQNWSLALTLSIFQLGVLAFLTTFQRWSHSDLNIQQQNHLLHLVEFKWGLIVPFASLFILLYSPIQAWSTGIHQIQFLALNNINFATLFMHSFFISLVVGFLLFLLSLLVIYLQEINMIESVLRVYMSPGPILLGFCFILIEKWVSLPLLLIFLLGMGIMFFTGLYRMILDSPLQSLKKQSETARVLGATPLQIMLKIILPQMRSSLVVLTSMGSLWAIGDFAFSKVVSSEDYHLSMLIKSLSNQYRLDAAQVLSLSLYGIAILIFIIWWGIGHVASRKFNR